HSPTTAGAWTHIPDPLLLRRRRPSAQAPFRTWGRNLGRVARSPDASGRYSERRPPFRGQAASSALLLRANDLRPHAPCLPCQVPRRTSRDSPRIFAHSPSSRRNTSCQRARSWLWLLLGQRSCRTRDLCAQKRSREAEETRSLDSMVPSL